MADTVGGGFPSSGVQFGSTFYDIDDKTTWVFISGNPRLVSSWKLLNGTFAGDPDTSLWGTNQAGATWLNTSLNTLRVWTGSSIVTVRNLNVANSALWDYKTQIVYQDDFVTGVTSNGTIGVLNWFIVGGTVSLPVSEYPHLGILQRNTSTTSGTVSSLLLSGQQRQIPLECGYDLLWICRVVTVDVNTLVRIGMNSTATVNPLTADAAVFEKSFTDVNWFATVYIGGVATRINTNTPVDNTWHEFRIVYSLVGGYSFFIDNVLVGTHTIGIPIAAMQPATHIVNNAAAAKILDHDYFQIIISGISR